MVDEYQDTDSVQFEIIWMLAGGHGSLFCVGDDDQSIYGFRGTDISIIRGFSEHFPDADIIRLEQNYRSTDSIVSVSNAVIEHNSQRLGKVLWTENAAGVQPAVCHTGSDQDEAKWISGDIMERHGRHSEAFSSCAVLFRLRRCSKAIEDQLVQSGRPYRIISGTSFYSRAEIKDMMAWLTLLVNPQADQFAERIINTPRRGIGKAAAAAIGREAALRGEPFMGAARNADGCLPAHLADRIADFVALFDQLKAGASGRPAAEVLREVYQATGYEKMLLSDKAVGRDRIENIGVLLSTAAQFDADGGGMLADFVQSIALMTDQDAAGDDDAVQLMTVHAAKGLEFDNVYVAGLDEGVFPCRRAVETGNVEEERRLCYVAMTRAWKRLIMLHGYARHEFRKVKRCRSSRFLSELPPGQTEILDPAAGKRQAAAAARREAIRSGESSAGNLFQSKPFRVPGDNGGPYCIMEDPALSKLDDARFVVVGADSGDVLDDANGYGYKSAQKALNAWKYKRRHMAASTGWEQILRQVSE